MKKSIIAAGAASVALAAMPIVSTFAAYVTDGTTSDSINATITSGCAITDPTPQKTVAISVAPGNTAESTAAGSISIVCTGVTWQVQAAGDGEEDYENYLTETVSSGTPERIASDGSAAAGVSNWLYKVPSVTLVDGTAGTLPDAVKNWHAVPEADSPETIYSGSSAITATVNTQYQVTASLAQKAGAYTGKVTYTVAHNES